MYHDRVKIYTRSGDGGETSLFSGGRVSKTDPRIEAYGTVDELSSWLGLLSTEPLPEGVPERLASVQRALFEIGGRLADAEGRAAGAPAVDVTRLEAWIDEMDGELPALKSFVLPGGCRAAALAHLARTVCRRAERRVVAVGPGEPGVDEAVRYLNRLSDALFVLARLLNRRLGMAETTWPGTGKEGG